HPWWRARAWLRGRLTDSWLVGGGAEHLWRDFQPRGADRAPAGLPSGYVRDTLFFAEATWKPPTSPWSLYLYGGGSPQAAFTPRVALEATPAYQVVKGLVVAFGYKLLGFDGQVAHL